MPVDHTSLLGTYSTPTFNYGDIVMDEVRGDVEIVGLTDARIPWPVGKRGRAKSLVVFAGLTAALRTESASAVCYWWGITAQTVSKWRSVLEVGQYTDGTVRLKSLAAKDSPGIAKALKLAHKKSADPERRRKIAEARRGKPRPPEVGEAVRRAHLGKKHSNESRRKMSESQSQRKRPPSRPWTRDEDELLGRMSDEQVGVLTGRSEKAVKARRKELGIRRSGM